MRLPFRSRYSLTALNGWLLLVLLPLFGVLVSTSLAYGQPRAAAAAPKSAGAPRIRIVLLGSTHFTPSTSDVYKGAAVDLTTAPRQPQVQAVIDKLAAFHPDQICIEWTAAKQAKLDSVYQTYLKGSYKLKSDEIDQFAFRTAKQLKLPRLTAVNYRGEFDMDRVAEFAKAHHQEQILADIDGFAKPIMADYDEKNRALLLRDYLIYINTPAQLDANAAVYSGYLARIGEGAEYPGVDLVSAWYNTNLHIYANLLRRIQPTDKAVVVIFGQGHIPILKSLFATNPAFEVVEVRDVLK
ncbi:MAG: hypothetical protein H7330_01590 [Hymenobacteraceae bacterium]|nr:hypothetical protein [Hymenobacteraceae bacterium]